MGLGLLGVLALVVFVWFVVVPYPWFLGSRNPERTAVMEERIVQAREADVPFEIRQQWVPLDQISPNLQRAVLVAEDDAFHDHDGIDWNALAQEVRWQGGETFSWTSGEDRAALWAALAYVRENRDAIRGRSTITQQVAKNLYFGLDRSFLRKAMEFVVARRLERRLEKDRILEIYLNVAEWGPGIFGAEAASRAYFDRPAADLTRNQAAALAGTLPHPLTSNPERNPGQMQWRQNLILQRMSPAPGVRPPPMPLPPMELTGDTAPSGVPTPDPFPPLEPAPLPDTAWRDTLTGPDTIPPPDTLQPANPPPPPDTLRPPGTVR